MKVTLSFADWKGGNVASAKYEIDIAEPIEKLIERMRAKEKESREKKRPKESAEP